MTKYDQFRVRLTEAIRRKIKQEGWTQSHAAEISGTHHSHMNNIVRETENGIGLKKLIQVAEAFGLKVELLIDGK